MPNKLYVFLEGNDDERFFKHILAKLLSGKYSKILAMTYAEEPPKITKKYIKAIISMGDAYIFFHDINDSPCVTACKEKVRTKYQVEENSIMIIVKEIECWYLCGLDSDCCKKLKIDRNIGNTNSMTKEDFDDLIPEGISRIEFMQQILEKHKCELGRQKNESFRYFLRKWID